MKFIIVPFLRALSIVDYAYRRLAGLLIKYPYERQGHCSQCGECCRCILIGLHPRYLKISWIRNLVIWWYEHFNDLILIGSLLEDGYIAFTCKHIQDTGVCNNYTWLRPWFCYEYPRSFSYFEQPVTLPGCSYSFRAISSRK